MTGQIGHYRIVEKIGAGGMGEVYRAHDEQLDRDVAIKLLPAQSFTDDTARARLLREARAAAALNHPHICTIHEVGEADGQAYIAMELIEGRPLAEMIPRGGLPAEQALRYGAQIADALAHAHERGIVHRDLKSGNVVITSEGRAKVLDFGLAKRVSTQELVEATTESQASLTQPGAVLGTLPYMAPEQLRGQPADARSDVWALGVVLHEIAAGARPFQGQTGYELSSAILNQAPGPLPAKVPVELRAVIERCLAKEPAQRYQRAGEARAALEAIATGTAIPWLKWKYLAKRRGFRVTAAVIAVALLVGALLGLNVAGLRDRLFGPARPKIESLAVLPLKTDGENESEYLADGISEALTTKLAQLPNVRVIPWMTAQRFRRSTEPLTTIAEEMRVDGLITGSVRESGGRVSVTISLVDGRSGLQSWGDEFEEPVTDLFVLQRRIALAAATKLKGELSGHLAEKLAEPPSRSAESYEYYLRGNAAWKRRSKESNDLAFELFRKSLQLDPELAEAHVGLGMVERNRYYYGWEGNRRNLEKAQASFETALRLNPRLSSAFEGLAVAHWERGRSEECLKQAQQLERLGAEQPEDLYVRGNAYRLGGLAEKAIPVLQRVMEMDPANEPAQLALVAAYLWEDRFHETIAAGELHLRKFGGVARAHWATGIAYHQLGDFDNAIAHYDKSIQLAPDDFVPYLNLGVVYNQTARPEMAKQVWSKGLAVLDRMLAVYPDNPRLRSWRAMFYGHLGNRRALLVDETHILAQWSDNGQLLANLGRAHAALGDVDRAVEHFRRALRLGWVYHLGTYKAEGLEQLQNARAHREFLAERDAERDRLRALY